MDQPNAIKLNDRALSSLIDSNLGLPFAILNKDIANENRLHKITCTYVRRSMEPDNKKENKTGSHWLVIADEVDTATKNCNGKHCWNN
ncbi:MAG: hypothetical protein ACREBJ_06470 [Nitrosotalea sp.]